MRFTGFDNISAPWRRFYGDVPAQLDYPDGSMFDAVAAAAARDASSVAVSYMNRDWTYEQLMDSIDAAARAFVRIGVRAGERIVICLPNIPQAVACLYALNRLGAVACFVHPLSAETEIAYCIAETGAKRAVALDRVVPLFLSTWAETGLETLISVTPVDELNPLMRVAYPLTAGKGVEKVSDERVTTWREFVRNGEGVTLPEPIGAADDDAVVLFSGGTTGVTKGVRITNMNMNALAFETVAMSGRPVRGRSMLAAMPVFHGFGLGVCVHTMLVEGGRSILVPRVIVKEYAQLIKRKKPNYIAGVPTLYEAMTRNQYLDGVDLGSLDGVFSGGDALPVELKKRFDAYLADHGAGVHVREGYGLTECVAASCLTPIADEREGSIGIPYPDMYYKICDPSTGEELPFGEAGEICICGPTVMAGYLRHTEDNQTALRVHDDGHTWLHTGDLGVMDADGFVYFKQRIKRMIITSGFNVYPSQIEAVLDSHPAVRLCCVIGVDDPYRVQKVKAFVVPNDGYDPTPELKEDIMRLCRKHIAHYALPRELEFRNALPTTAVGKVAYTELEKQEKRRP